jgi:hypothetical protein
MVAIQRYDDWRHRAPVRVPKYAWRAGVQPATKVFLHPLDLASCIVLHEVNR